MFVAKDIARKNGAHDGVLQHVIRAGIGVGAGKPDGFLRPEHVTEEKLRCVRALAEIAASRGQSLAQMSIAWLLAKPYITSVLIGASRWAQIEENLGGLRNTSFSTEELAAIDHAGR